MGQQRKSNMVTYPGISFVMA